MKSFIKSCVVLLVTSLLALAKVHASSTVTFYHHDALGSVIATSNQYGDIDINEEYQPYGEKIYEAVDYSGGGDDWYTGKNYSRELDLTYFGARWYDAKQGRFLSMDPAPVTLGNIHSFNRYVYGSNNPYKFIDPDGEEVTFFGNPTISQAQAQVVLRELEPRMEVDRGVKGFRDIRSGASAVNTAIAFARLANPKVNLNMYVNATEAIFTFVEVGSDLALQGISEAESGTTTKVSAGKAIKNSIIERVGKRYQVPREVRSRLQNLTDMPPNFVSIAEDVSQDNSESIMP